MVTAETDRSWANCFAVIATSKLAIWSARVFALETLSITFRSGPAQLCLAGLEIGDELRLNIRPTSVHFSLPMDKHSLGHGSKIENIDVYVEF
jgi:hypothetical protein